jgi:putative tryptophan/tyrosine transport system substrate-binding protein
MFRRVIPLSLLLTLAVVIPAPAQTHSAGQIHRVGIVFQGGPYYSALDGLREGLNGLGLRDGQHVALIVRDAKGDLNAVDAAARGLERDGVALIVAFATSVSLAVKQATATVPVVFAVGSDPAHAGLVDSFAKPGGRLTGIHNVGTDVVGKRFELLREILPTARRAITFYSPQNRTARESVVIARDVAQQLGFTLSARPMSTVEDLQTAVRALRPGETDAYVFVSDAMVNSQAQLIIDTANAIRLPTVAYYLDVVARGALAAYGVSYRELGRLAATYVHRILMGKSPSDLPVQAVNRLGLIVNLKTAKALGLALPQSLTLRADALVQ